MTSEHHVFGPPGTGKTTYLTRQAQRAAERYAPHRVMVASLTRAAAAEVAGRETSIPHDRIGTLHAHAYRGLGRPRLAEDAQGYREWNEFCAEHNPEYALGGDAKSSVEWGWEVPAENGGRGAALLLTVQTLRARLLPREQWPGQVQMFAAAWDAWKEEAERYDFTDLIERAICELPRAPGNPAVLLLDEAQDMSALEMVLARQWGTRCEQFVVVGDADQNLYAWRGTDARAAFGGAAATERVLERSYRVPRDVHSAALRWIELTEGFRPLVRYLPREGSRGVLRGAECSLHDVSAVIQYITEGEGTTMLLATCGYLLRPVAHRLRELGIAYHNPYRPDRAEWNPMRGGARRLAAFLRPLRSVWGAHARPHTWEDVRAWIEPLRSRGLLVPGAKTLVARRCEEQAAAPRFTVLRDLLFIDPSSVQLDVGWHEDHILASWRSRMQFAYHLAHRDPSALTRDPSLILGTIHAVKGGEADRVILAPDVSIAGWLRGWRSSQVADRDAVRRQIYVGMTRAREELHLLQPASQLAVDIGMLLC